jgi:Zn-dependent protease with chaperone function
VTTAAGDGRPRSSTLRLVALVLEGYVYLGVILALFLAPPAILLWGLVARRPSIAIAAILVGIPVTATAARALRAVWVAFEEPKGIEVGPHFGQGLEREVDQVARLIGAPAVHRIVVTDAPNASVLQVARAGVFWSTHTLCLGYPLLATMSVEHIRAVIAHELAHLTQGHGHVSGWVHRTRLAWSRLIGSLEQHDSVPPVLYLLFRRYVPRLCHHAAAVSREQELLADRVAADVSGPEVAAQALVAVEIVQDVLNQQFWPRLFERVDAESAAPAPFASMGPHIWRGLEHRTKLLDRILEGESEASDTHPTLRERLRALHHEAEWPDAGKETAADSLFGAQKTELVAALDEDWRERYGREWTRRHDEIRRRRQALAALAALPSPTREDTFRRGELTELEGDTEAALSLFLAAHERGHAPAALAAGRLLLDRDDDSGIGLIEAAMEAQPDLVEQGCTAIVAFLKGRGRHADAQPYEHRQTLHASRAMMANAERTTLSRVDRFEPCVDPRFDPAALADRLSAEPRVVRAYLARKELRHSPGTLTILAVLMKSGSMEELAESLYRERLVPRDVLVAPLPRHDPGLESALGPSTLVFDGSRRGHGSRLARG